MKNQRSFIFADFSYHHSHHSQQQNSHDYHYNHHQPDRHHLPPPPKRRNHYRPPNYDYKSYEPYLPPTYYDQFDRDREHWGFKKHGNGWGTYGGSYGNFGRPSVYYDGGYDQRRNHNRYDYDYGVKNYYLPVKKGNINDWGVYGGTYGNGGSYSQADNYDYWGFSKQYGKGHQSDGKYYNYGELPPIRAGDGSYIPDNRGTTGYPVIIPISKGTSYLPAKPDVGYPRPTIAGRYLPTEGDSFPQRPFGYDFVKDGNVMN